ncbi:PREDICTED: uncharacterized protein LOC105462051 [Wasmannia auropunctata]|uniref:uncharacterized protein LOC105462051 n=1 Tax=Wasmannia auropunctata TaxID=64793 RepID=UPI0005EF11A9|nr:PREDICTED: uncharacterized protein LOC105462051 [Wasmannia auropunctata]
MPIFVDAFITECRKCSNNLKENLEIKNEWYKTNQPEKWKLIVAKLNELKRSTHLNNCWQY